MCDVLVLFYWSNSTLYTREREAKSFVVCWLNVFNAGKQKWSENKPLWLSHSLTRWTLSPRLTSFFTCPGLGWCIQEQPRPHRCGSNLWGAKEERHWVPCVRSGDAVAYTHTSEGRNHRVHTFLSSSWIIFHIHSCILSLSRCF